MGFLQNKLMKKSFNELNEIIRAPELAVEILPTPRELHADFRKYSDNMLRISVFDWVSVFVVYESGSYGDCYTYGVMTNESGIWAVDLDDLIHSPFGVTDTYSEGLAILLEAATALSFLTIAKGEGDEDFDADDVAFFTETLAQKFGISLNSTNRGAILQVIRSMGSQHPSIAVGAMMTF
jgi:hypothetical protein